MLHELKIEKQFADAIVSVFELNVYQACLNCRWREFEEMETLGSKGTVYIFECKKLPVCKLVDGQEKFKAEVEQ